ncbi:sulfatase-like hydrolase/transferase [Paraglaciecola sp. Hal342]
MFPVYPDIPAFQYTHAYYLQQHQILDNKIGQTLDALRADGLLEDTFIFYFGDHGGALPASKGTIYDRGLNIPLVVRIPKNYQHLLHSDFSAPNNVRVKGVVSFIDFAPTLLELAGLEKPPQQDGESFLSNTMSLAELNSRDTTFSYAEPI